MKSEYYNHLSGLPTEDLVRIAYFELRKSKKEARQAAKRILKERNIKDDIIREFKADIRVRKQMERRAKLRDNNEE